MTLIHVRRKSDYAVVEISTQDPRRDEDYVGLSYQPLGKHKGEPYTVPTEAQEKTQTKLTEAPVGQQEISIEALREQYFKINQKQVPIRYKNDRGRILSHM